MYALSIVKQKAGSMFQQPVLSLKFTVNISDSKQAALLQEWENERRAGN